jgi:hypothetical protein
MAAVKLETDYGVSQTLTAYEYEQERLVTMATDGYWSRKLTESNPSYKGRALLYPMTVIMGLTPPTSGSP